MATLELITDVQAELINGGFSLINFRPYQKSVVVVSRGGRLEAEKGGEITIDQTNVAKLIINL